MYYGKPYLRIKATDSLVIKRMESVYAYSQRFRTALLNEEDKAVNEIRDAYTTSISSLEEELSGMESRAKDYEARGLNFDTLSAMMDRTRQMIKELELRVNTVNEEAVQYILDGQESSVNAVDKNTGKLIASTDPLLPKEITATATYNRIPKEALTSFIGSSSPDSPLGKLISGLAKDTSERFRNTLATAIVSGNNPRQVARDLEKVIQSAQTDINVSRSRLETIARTEMIRSAREGQKYLYESNPAVVGYQRQATQDGRTCLACLALSGKKYPTSEIMPSHPNCRCVMLPITLSAEYILGESTDPGLNFPAIGPEALLSGMSEGEKLQIMGPSRYALYQQGVPLDKMVNVVGNETWGPTTQVLPLSRIGKGKIPADKKLVIPPPPGSGPGTPAPAPVTPTVAPAIPAPKVTKPLPAPLPVGPVIGDRSARNPNRVWNGDRYVVDVKAVTDFIERTISTLGVKPNAANYSSWSDYKDERLDWEARLKPAKDQYFQMLLADTPSEVTVNAKENRKEIERILNLINQIVEKRPVKLDVNVERGGSRAYYQAGTRTIRIDKATESGKAPDWKGIQSLSDIYRFTSHLRPTEWFSTLTHEYGHHLDHQLPGSKEARRKAFEDRTAGEPMLTEGPLSSWGFTYKKDKFFDKYVGRVYDSNPDRHGVEIPSMGLEYMVRDPFELYKQDPETLKHILEHIL
ncbi:Phage head morphogenesis domain [uncultured Caudovirales phage]|uniref:Phage head morphogenesis domain n=1 Tax=uncultured Caudovirales phage TaxID=2100421 RepID=A0A6J7XD86_9CAUD|nr:Phage head morphogenesis domain [uncultured Caudovirales phage]